MTIGHKLTDYDTVLGNKHTSSPNLFSKFLDYGSRAAKVIGGVLKGPTGYADAASEFAGMVKDKMDGKL